EVGGQCPRRHLEADLIVALAGASMGDGIGSVLARRGDQVLHDDRSRQRRDQWVLAFVLGIGLDGRRHEVVGVLLLAVDHNGFDRAGGNGPLPYGFEVAALADVGGHGNDLDPQLLCHPAHRDTRVEAAAVRQNHSLGQRLFSLIPHRPASDESRLATFKPPTRSAATAMIVSSPATVPRMSSSPARSRAEATTWADPGGVRSTTRLAE